MLPDGPLIRQSPYLSVAEQRFHECVDIAYPWTAVRLCDLQLSQLHLQHL